MDVRRGISMMLKIKLEAFEKDKLVERKTNEEVLRDVEKTVR